MLTPEQEAIAQTFLVPFETPEHLRAWCHSFLDIDFPLGSIDPTSNSSPSEWMFEAYKTIKNNEGDVKPTFVVYSSRDSFKTLSCAAMEIIGMVHFNLTIAHMAAIESQSKKTIEYVTSFLKKIKPYLEYHGRSIDSQNTRNLSVVNKDGDVAYLTIIIATLTGSNSAHTNFMCVDGDSRILIANPDVTSNRKRTKIAAKTLYKKLNGGEKHNAFSFNHLSGKMEFKQITAWHENTKQLNVIKTTDKMISATDEHRFFIAGKGYVQVSDIQIGDNLLFLDKSSGFANKSQSETPVNFITDYDHKNTTELEQFLLGSLLGDGGVYKKTSNNAYYQETHCMEQKEYAEWKRSILSKTFLTRNYISVGGYNNTEQYKISTGNTPLLNKWTSFKETFDGIEKLGPLGLAIWYMDDGCKGRDLRFSTEGFQYNQQVVLKSILKSNFNINVEIKPSKDKYYFLQGSIEDQYKLYQICKDYIHPSMLYKFDHLLKTSIGNCKGCNKEYLRQTVSHSGKYCADKVCQSIKNKQFHLYPVVSIERGETKKVYDFTVEDNHNYITNGFLSHNCVDEVDVVRFPQAYEEAKMIPGMLKGRFPITVMTSTRKFAFGLMQKEIEIANENGHPVLHWNILDITEKCQPERHKPELPKVVRYVAKRLPFRNMSQEEYDAILPEKKVDYEGVEGYAGCATCALFQVCRTRLAHRPDRDVGGLYKPISFTINQFKKVTPDMAEAQLLCLKPSSTGLVYPRFDESEGENVITLNQAWEAFYGSSPDFEVTLNDLIDVFKKKGIRFYVGGDWGFRHAYALIAAAILPSGDFWIFETLAIPGLEFEEMIKYAEYFRDKYRPAKWFMDTAQPMFIKGFRKRGMPCKDFKKDVLGGIEAIRGQIVDASNRRRLKILKTTENQFLVDGFNKHHFITDAAGNVTQTPDDEMHSDVLDSTRYLGQNLFEPKKKLSAGASNPILQADKEKKRLEMYRNSPEKIYSDALMSKINSLTTEVVEEARGMNDTGTVIWDFSHPINDKS